MTDRYPPFRLDQGGTDPGSQPADPTAVAVRHAGHSATGSAPVG